jgi:thiaminase
MADEQLEKDFIKFVNKINSNQGPNLLFTYLMFRDQIISFGKRFEENFQKQLSDLESKEIDPELKEKTKHFILSERQGILNKFFNIWIPCEDAYRQSEDKKEEIEQKAIEIGSTFDL